MNELLYISRVIALPSAKGVNAKRTRNCGCIRKRVPQGGEVKVRQFRVKSQVQTLRTRTERRGF